MSCKLRTELSESSSWVDASVCTCLSYLLHTAQYLVLVHTHPRQPALLMLCCLKAPLLLLHMQWTGQYQLIGHAEKNGALHCHFLQTNMMLLGNLAVTKPLCRCISLVPGTLRMVRG